jgi:hypothetical protein
MSPDRDPPFGDAPTAARRALLSVAPSVEWSV